MKYLRYINEALTLDEEAVKEKLSPFINWELIDDIKEMALEYIDEGVTLQVSIVNQDCCFCKVYYNHSWSETIWSDSVFNTDIRLEWEKELLERSKSAYPEEQMSNALRDTYQSQFVKKYKWYNTK